MFKNKLNFLAAALTAVFLLALTPAELSDMVKKADALQDDGKYEESNKLLAEVLKADPNSRDAYWMTARNYFNLGEELPESKEKEKLDLYIKCEETARKGAEKNPNVAENYFYTAVGMSQEALVRGIARSLGKAKEIEKYYLKTLDMHPTYKTATDSTEANANFALCQFYRKVPESSIMRLLFGTKGDLDKAITHCSAAVKILPDQIEYVKEMGVVLVCRGERRNVPSDVEVGKRWLQKTQTMTAKTKIDKIDQQDSLKVMKDPKLACGYSRVKQEEVSESEIKK
jgi:tetratricopeptide (TPR) repeat protein